MFNDEQEINFFGSSFTTTEEKTENKNNQTYDFPKSELSTEKQTNIDSFEDDYSINQNFEEQTNYDIGTQDSVYSSTEKQEKLRPIDMPLIEKPVEEVTEPAYQPINLSARMKIVLSSFVVIVASLLFATVWNFIAIAKLNSTIADKTAMVNELQVSITNLSEEYDLLGDSEHLKDLMENAGYIESNDSNTITISLDDMYKEHVIEEIPSNWFNDVCNFITSLFKW